MDEKDLIILIGEAVESGLLWESIWGYCVSTEELTIGSSESIWGYCASSEELTLGSPSSHEARYGFISRRQLIRFLQQNPARAKELRNRINITKTGKIPSPFFFRVVLDDIKD